MTLQYDQLTEHALRSGQPPYGLFTGITGVLTGRWDLYALVFAAAFGGWVFYNNNLPRKVLKPTEFQEFPLVKKTVLSPNTAIYRFKLPVSTDILGLPTGQHVSLAAVPKGESKEVIRSYTPISNDETPGFVDLIIKTYPKGNISKHVSTLEIGQTMKFRGPKGAMVYRPNMVRKIGMIAGGTGITPMFQIAQTISRGRGRGHGDKTSVDLIFANVLFDDILLKEALDELAKGDDGINVHYVLNSPPTNWDGGVGFVTQDMIREKLPAPAADVKIFICGPPPMVSVMKKYTEALGFEKARPVSKLEDQVFCF